MASSQNKTFISYSHRDGELKEKLVAELLAQPDFDNDYWEDSRLEAGENWFERIEDAVNQANSVILIASAAFFGSKFIRKHELGPFLERLESSSGAELDEGEEPVKIIIVPIGEEGAENIKKSSLESLQAVVDISRPFDVDSDDAEDRKQVVRDIAKSIRRAIDKTKVDLEDRLETEHRPVQIVRTLNQGKRANLYHGEIQWPPKREVVIKTLGSAATTSDRWSLYKELPEKSELTEIANVVPIYWTDLSASPPYYVMRYMDESLNGYIDDNGQLNWNRAQQILLKIGSALATARSKGLLDQFSFDIRPSHVLIELKDSEPEPYLSFAPRVSKNPAKRLAKLLTSTELGPDGKERITYVLPESLDTRSKAPEPEVSDMYLLGLMGIHMMSGKIPEPVSLAEDTSDDAPTFAFPTRELFSKEKPESFELWDDWAFLAIVVEKMAAIDPNDRFENLGAALDALRRPRHYALAEVRASFSRCGPTDEFLKDFYRDYFARSEDIAPFFEHFGDEKIGRGERWRRQKEMVEKAIAMLFAYFDEYARCKESGAELDPRFSVLSYFAERHKVIMDERLDALQKDGGAVSDIDPSWFDDFVESIAAVAASRDTSLSGPDNERTARMRPLIEELWRQVLMPGAAYLRSFHE